MSLRLNQPAHWTRKNVFMKKRTTVSIGEQATAVSTRVPVSTESTSPAETAATTVSSAVSESALPSTPSTSAPPSTIAWYTPVCDNLLRKIGNWYFAYERSDVAATRKWVNPAGRVVYKPGPWANRIPFNPTELDHLIRILETTAKTPGLVDYYKGVKNGLKRGKLIPGEDYEVILNLRVEEVEETLQCLMKAKTGELMPIFDILHYAAELEDIFDYAPELLIPSANPVRATPRATPDEPGSVLVAGETRDFYIYPEDEDVIYIDCPLCGRHYSGSYGGARWYTKACCYSDPNAGLELERWVAEQLLAGVSIDEVHAELTRVRAAAILTRRDYVERISAILNDPRTADSYKKYLETGDDWTTRCAQQDTAEGLGGCRNDLHET